MSATEIDVAKREAPAQATLASRRPGDLARQNERVEHAADPISEPGGVAEMRGCEIHGTLEELSLQHRAARLQQHAKYVRDAVATRVTPFVGKDVEDTADGVCRQSPDLHPVIDPRAQGHAKRFKRGRASLACRGRFCSLTITG